MQPDEIIPLDPDEFFAAHEYAAMVAENEFLEEIPVLRGKLRIDSRVLRFANVPENRFGLAVMRFFRERKHDKGWSFMVRFFAMMGIMRRMSGEEEMQPFIKKNTEGGSQFHRAVFEVAATQKLNSKLEFSSASFLRAVQQVAKSMDTGQDDSP
jgi:hypothetical protein